MGPDIMIVVLITMLIGLIIILAVNRYQKKFLERKYQLAQEELNANFIQKTRDLESVSYTHLTLPTSDLV